MAPHNPFDENFRLNVREELRRADSEIFPDNPSIPDEVTHYTSFAGLKGIIEKQEIWCTDIREVDDSSECDYGMDVIRNIIARKSVPKEFVMPVLRHNSLFGAKDRFTFFIACFCSAQSESRMWEYADDGAGFAIVFDAKRLFDASDGGNAYGFAPVIYDEGEQIDKTAKVIDRAIRLQRDKGLPPGELKRFWSGEVEFSLMLCGLRFKATRWKHQREVRIVVAEADSLNPFVHAGKTRVAVPLERPAIIRIVRGPKHTGTDTTEQIREILIHAGYGNDLAIL